MRRREAKAAGDAVYIKWLEERLFFFRLVICVLVGLIAILTLTFEEQIEEAQKPPRSIPTYHSYSTPRPTPATSSGGNPLEQYIPKSQEKTVYVSRSGLIHTRSNCSGMKYYTEMTLSEALEDGYKRCSKCGYD